MKKKNKTPERAEKSKKKERDSNPSPEKEGSKWQDFLHRHKVQKEKK